jgi:hypothetical protein
LPLNDDDATLLSRLIMDAGLTRQNA